MGLFDKWKNMQRSRTLKAAEKHGSTLKKMMTNKDQREEAIDALAHMDADIAIPQLMKRFEMVFDHGIQDTREKEKIVEYLMEHLDIAKPLVVDALKNQKRISWPIKLAEKMFDKEEYLNLLTDNLGTEFVSFDESVQERNIELMLALKDFSDNRIVEKVIQLLAVRDENVKIAAIECLEAQAKEVVSARDHFKELMNQEPDDSNSRIVGLAKSIVEKHGWQ